MRSERGFVSDGPLARLVLGCSAARSAPPPDRPSMYRDFKMKHVPFRALLVISLLTGAGVTGSAWAQANAASTAATAKAHELTNAEFEALLTHPESVLLIDLRRPDEVAHLGGFPVYLSIQAAELEKSLKWIPKDRAIVTISNHTGRSGRAANLLASHGFKIAGVLGARTYEEHGGKLAKIAPPAQAGGASAAGAK